MAGIDINLKTIRGTALHMASEKGHTSVVSLLLFKGVNKTWIDN